MGKSGSMKGKVKDMGVKMESSNTHLVGVLEGEDRENGGDIIFEATVAENFSKLTKRKICRFRKYSLSLAD